MESCIRIVYDEEADEYIIEAYGTESLHLGSRSFSAWSSVCYFLASAEVSVWLREIASGEMTDTEAEQKVGEWPT